MARIRAGSASANELVIFGKHAVYFGRAHRAREDWRELLGALKLQAVAPSQKSERNKAKAIRRARRTKTKTRRAPPRFYNAKDVTIKIGGVEYDGADFNFTQGDPLS